MRFALANDWRGDELNSWYVAVTRARRRLQLPERFWALHDAVWGGAGFDPGAGGGDAPEYSPEEVAGINELLGKMRSALPCAGSEVEDAAAGAPSQDGPSPAGDAGG